MMSFFFGLFTEVSYSGPRVFYNLALLTILSNGAERFEQF